MISIALLDDLLKRMLVAGLIELDVRDGDASIAMRLGAKPTATARNPVPVRSQGIGVFRATHPRRPNGAPKPGDNVLKGTALGYLEASGTLTAIIAPTSGTLSETRATEGELLGYGAHVFTLEESA
jgi:biotin carboxyl carrier protein